MPVSIINVYFIHNVIKNYWPYYATFLYVNTKCCHYTMHI